MSAENLKTCIMSMRLYASVGKFSFRAVWDCNEIIYFEPQVCSMQPVYSTCTVTAYTHSLYTWYWPRVFIMPLQGLAWGKIYNLHSKVVGWHWMTFKSEWEEASGVQPSRRTLQSWETGHRRLVRRPCGKPDRRAICGTCHWGHCKTYGGTRGGVTGQVTSRG